ncbi:hypothetical protein K9L67_02135 [Candidatus Woesearchaeota archaeon]|nr:hypothetical protein [Candidatus Woesearchaeota archaeon]MCF7901003.1 hypothetical protein [Candidatus Woesearchaeota archaeon]MCF8013281.1 hypothetical protein [Candidatus Woesearchaeota archaeon]
MELKIINETKSALPRKEIICTLAYDVTTPSRQQLIQSISTKQKAKSELVVVKKINPNYGEKTAEVTAYIYDNEDALKAIEFPKVLEKNTLKKVEKTEEPTEEESKSDETKQQSETNTDKMEGEQ